MSNNSFLKLCKIFEAISASKGKNSKKQIVLQPFVDDCGRGLQFYNALRLFLPNWERERGPYRLGQHTFTKTLAKIYFLTPNGSDVNLLRNFNQSATGIAAKFNDYADAAFSIVRKRTLNEEPYPYTLEEINIKLDAIASGNIRKQEELLYHLFKSLSQLEIKWIIRILLRDLKLGLGKDDILNCYHKDAAKYFNTNNSLRQLCIDLADRNRTAADFEVTLFNAFRPMLSMRCDAKEFNKAVTDDLEVYVEEKFDGERFQVHFGGEKKFKYFSRNGYDYTEEFQLHAQIIQGCLKAESLILDGEMMIYNKSTKKFGSKGMWADIKRVKVESNIQPCFCIFDILYHNGINMCNIRLSDRKRMIQKVVTPRDGLLLVSAWKNVQGRQAIVDELNTSMDRKEEGIVFKDPKSTYLPNERIGWWKVKLEYFEGVMSDLDVLILGGYYGQGATKGEITGYLVGVKNAQLNKYLSFAKISTGLTREQAKGLNRTLDPHWRVDQNYGQFGIVFGKEKPDRWIPPSSSICLQVRGSELIKLYHSTAVKDYATNYTLRFPRILSIRRDKRFDDCLTAEELTRLTEGSSAVEKLSKRHLDLGDLRQAHKKKRKLAEVNLELPVDIVSDILEGQVFVVISGKGDWDRESVEKAIRENGGTIALDVTNDTRCLLAGDEHVRTGTYKGEKDIVKVDWLRRVLNEGGFEMYGPLDVLYLSETSRRKFMQEFDKFGDSYIEDADRRSFGKVVENYMEIVKLKMHPTVDEIIELNAEIKLPNGWKPLRGYSAYFDRYKIISVPTSTAIDSPEVGFFERTAFKMAGGCVSPYLNEDCDCIIASPDRLEEIRVYLQSIRRDIPIYSSTEGLKKSLLEGQQD